jgi:hypothetical protein
MIQSEKQNGNRRIEVIVMRGNKTFMLQSQSDPAAAITLFLRLRLRKQKKR